MSDDLDVLETNAEVSVSMVRQMIDQWIPDTADFSAPSRNAAKPTLYKAQKKQKKSNAEYKIIGKRSESQVIKTRQKEEEDEEEAKTKKANKPPRFDPLAKYLNKKKK